MTEDSHQVAQEKQDTPPKPKSKWRRWVLVLLIMGCIAALTSWFFPENVKFKFFQVRTTEEIPQKPAQRTRIVKPRTEVSQVTVQTQQQIQSLQNRMKILEQQASSFSAPALKTQLTLSPLPDFQPLFTAFEALEQQTQTAKPFYAQLENVFELLPISKELTTQNMEQLIQLSSRGVPTPEHLLAEFSELMSARTASKAQPQLGSQNGLNKIRDWARNLVRYTPPKQNGRVSQPKTALQNIYKQIRKGHLKSALNQAEKAKHKLGPKGVAWLNRLKERLFVDQHIQNFKIISLTLYTLAHATHHPTTSQEAPE